MAALALGSCTLPYRQGYTVHTHIYMDVSKENTHRLSGSLVATSHLTGLFFFFVRTQICCWGGHHVSISSPLTNVEQQEVEQQCSWATGSWATKKLSNNSVEQQEVEQQVVEQQRSWATGSWPTMKLSNNSVEQQEVDQQLLNFLLLNFLLLNFLLLNWIVAQLNCCSTSCCSTALLLNFRLLNFLLLNCLLLNNGECPFYIGRKWHL